MKSEKMDKQKNAIENMRERLHKEILNQTDEKQVLKISQELDKLIANYYKLIKVEEVL